MRLHSFFAVPSRLRPARGLLAEPSGLTARLFVDLGRTGSMLCQAYAT